MTNNTHEWRKTKTGLLIFDVEQSRFKGYLTAISEHGQRLHFTPSFIRIHAPNHAEIAAGEKRLGDVMERREPKQIRNDLKKLRAMGFHVITD